MKQTDLFNKFGVDKEEFEKTKDILPTLDFGKLDVGESVVLTIDANEPKEIEHDDKFNKGQKTKSKVISVIVHRYNRIGDHNDHFVVPMNNEKMTLWLSSKSLLYSLMKVLEDKEVKGTTIKITKDRSVYKNFGENFCYVVSEDKA